MLLIIILLFTLVPALEIFLFWLIGHHLGLGWTLFVIVATGILGAALAKKEGLQAWGRIHQALAEGRLPGPELVDALLIVVAGALLLTPGFFTDAVGFLLLLPPPRAWVRRLLVNAFKKRVAGSRWQVYENFGQRPPTAAADADEVIEVTPDVDPDPGPRRFPRDAD